MLMPFSAPLPARPTKWRLPTLLAKSEAPTWRIYSFIPAWELASIYHFNFTVGVSSGFYISICISSPYIDNIMKKKNWLMTYSWIYYPLTFNCTEDLKLLNLDNCILYFKSCCSSEQNSLLIIEIKKIQKLKPLLWSCGQLYIQIRWRSSLLLKEHIVEFISGIWSLALKQILFALWYAETALNGSCHILIHSSRLLKYW